MTSNKRSRLDLFQVNSKYFDSVEFQDRFRKAFRSNAKWNHVDSGASVVACAEKTQDRAADPEADGNKVQVLEDKVQVPEDKVQRPTDNAQNPTNIAQHPKDIAQDQRKINTQYPKGFPVGVLPRILDDQDMLEIRRHLLLQNFYKKRNDLYDFLQSEDLKCAPSDSPLTRLRNTIQSDSFIRFVSSLTGIELENGRVDLAGQRYFKGGHLLCHDDDVLAETTIGRRIAFIFYLVDEQWSKEDGGELEIFHRDETTNMPTPEAIHRILPRWNTMAFFEVTPTSYHQVAEVLGDKERVSITGWFYGSISESRKLWPEKDRKPCVDKIFHPLREPRDGNGTEVESLAARWIRPEYLANASTEKIRDFLAENSFVELQSFLTDAAFDKLQAGFRSLMEHRGKLVGPPNLRRYQCVGGMSVGLQEEEEVAAENAKAEGCNGETEQDEAGKEEEKNSLNEWNDFQHYLTSSAFQPLLRRWSGLDAGSYHAELRHFGRGNYTLLHDNGRDPKGVLDLFLDFSEADAEETSLDGTLGGEVIYVDDEDELLTVQPQKNKLTMIYRADNDVTGFVRYVPRSCPSRGRQDFMVQYQVR